MNWFDRCSESFSRNLARRSSRRSFLSKFGFAMVGGAAIPLLPVARANAEERAPNPEDPGDPSTCEYWRHCAIDGFLCSCCGGSQTMCPPGTEPSPITWIGTCNNPADGKDYVISYNDCCGKTSCGRCVCNRNEREEPMYRPQKSNDIDWCLGTKSAVYNCSTALVIGVATEPG
jgi:methylamine dehydrogenase light chain